MPSQIRVAHPWNDVGCTEDPETDSDAGGGTRRSRGHRGTLDNVIGGPGVWQRMPGHLSPSKLGPG